MDATTARVVDFTAVSAAAAAGSVAGGGGGVLATVSHDARIDWLVRVCCAWLSCVALSARRVITVLTALQSPGTWMIVSSYLQNLYFTHTNLHTQHTTNAGAECARLPPAVPRQVAPPLPLRHHRAGARAAAALCQLRAVGARQRRGGGAGARRAVRLVRHQCPRQVGVRLAAVFADDRLPPLSICAVNICSGAVHSTSMR